MRFRDWWLGRVREAGVSERDLAAALLRMRADWNATLGAQLVWMREAGFGEVDCRYKDHRFAVYSGKKGYEASEDGKDDDG
jgi:tRNA (cmo5U34)-methyltransferase